MCVTEQELHRDTEGYTETEGDQKRFENISLTT